MAERLKERVDSCKIAIFEVLSSMLIDNNPSISAKKKAAVVKLAPTLLSEICKNISHKNVEIRGAVISTVAALASTLREVLDKHIA